MAEKKKKRRQRLSLYPLSPDEALKKALAAPFVAPKKKPRPHK